MEEQDTTKLLMIREYYEPSHAHIAQGVLNAHGIECSLEGENANNLLHYRQHIVIPISLWVHEEDTQRVLRLLGQPIADPQQPAYHEEPRTGWKLIKHHLTNIWRALTIT